MNFSFENTMEFPEQPEGTFDPFSSFCNFDVFGNPLLEFEQQFPSHDNNNTIETDFDWDWDMLQTDAALQSWSDGIGNMDEEVDSANVSAASTMYSPYSLAPETTPSQQTSWPNTPLSTPDMTGSSSMAAPMRRNSSGHEKVAYRSRRALKEAIERGNRPILPSPEGTRPPSPNCKVDSGPLSKVSKGRKKEEKRRCEICATELSGDHEFERHFKLTHEPEGWRWQVIDPAEKGLRPRWQVALEISDCKNCQTNKLYGINYNAAAHIRRVHFKSAPKNGSKGGSSGGAWPEIRYLEYLYMKLVHIRQISSNKSKPKEGIDYERTGREQATILREPHSKRHSPAPAGSLSDAQGQSSPFQSFTLLDTDMDTLTPHDEVALPHTPGAGRTWLGRIFAPNNHVNLNSSPFEGHEHV